jgi:hypothetical protein
MYIAGIRRQWYMVHFEVGELETPMVDAEMVEKDRTESEPRTPGTVFQATVKLWAWWFKSATIAYEMISTRTFVS